MVTRRYEAGNQLVVKTFETFGSAQVLKPSIVPYNLFLQIIYGLKTYCTCTKVETSSKIGYMRDVDLRLKKVACYTQKLRGTSVGGSGLGYCSRNLPRSGCQIISIKPVLIIKAGSHYTAPKETTIQIYEGFGGLL